MGKRRFDSISGRIFSGSLVSPTHLMFFFLAISRASEHHLSLGALTDDVLLCAVSHLRTCRHYRNPYRIPG